jgi:hypothetical protein
MGQNPPNKEIADMNFLSLDQFAGFIDQTVHLWAKRYVEKILENPDQIELVMEQESEDFWENLILTEVKAKITIWQDEQQG